MLSSTTVSHEPHTAPWAAGWTDGTDVRDWQRTHHHPWSRGAASKINKKED